MQALKEGIKSRQLTLQDLDVVLMIDHKIRNMGKAITYEYLTTERIFTIDKKINRLKQPVSYIDLITGNVSELLEYGFVAEVEGHVRGFILGKVGHEGETYSPVGRILILGVHPDYWQKGIATKLVEIICEKFKSEGLRAVHLEVDLRDKPLLSFCECMGFDVGHRITYSKSL